MNKYIIPLNDNIFSVSTTEVEHVRSLLITGAHDSLEYHGTVSQKKMLRHQFGQNIKNYSARLGLTLAGIYAFTARPNIITQIHVDGSPENVLPYRLSIYATGKNGTINWFDSVVKPKYDSTLQAYIYPSAKCNQVFSYKIDCLAAFVRTDIPHQLDTIGTKTDRLTITATFKAGVSWEELQERVK